MTLANRLTLFRITLIPLLVIVFYLPFSWSYPAAGLVFSIAALTDWLDGYVARRYDQSTAFGAFLDPVADKLMVGVALVLLVGVHASAWMAVPAAVIIGREIVISALREWMAELGKRASVAVSYIGKIKTTLQMIAIILLLTFDPNQFPTWKLLGYVTLYVAAGLTLWSMIIYLRAAWPELMAEE
ncbi:MAG: CDP-diacylglycerol--glycerol-3-phosphate 3-phosphatidyltransferase [Gammaproteobacteria bacterium]|uniref:CDP-diacylglycerol--glycerol-3-phosphate 3-phosphatidyltransferase n=1 Tax=Pseudomaricurvus alcaniphilus TaxID=1166482 RepID=UPI00140C7C90|nr:CDP-diacylglycerol--glycerol-3-phosphate 3-phosphatidyltransferase [Pseudomaricurvus alcaniphilus]MBR9911510.1 CDP-diacylglycerol--glycerol-3-phosphate 3-phosphatidyltransferase [Gammaproteobacteria bacterium]NHN35925.1 CDP-diacylglycerol--glycerol-3-phosphate 3-phosphatidyltransferase [Pseudomaricurvus alcaniphilus]